MNPETIFWPMIVMALLTLFLYIPMLLRRAQSVKSGTAKASDYRLVENEPPEVRQMTRAIGNQYETPVLFYAVCLSAYVTNNVGVVMIALAWSFMGLKCYHVLIQTTSNRLRFRRPIFTLSYVVLIIMWGVFALKLGGLV